MVNTAANSNENSFAELDGHERDQRSADEIQRRVGGALIPDVLRRYLTRTRFSQRTFSFKVERAGEKVALSGDARTKECEKSHAARTRGDTRTHAYILKVKMINHKAMAHSSAPCKVNDRTAKGVEL